MTGLIFCGAPIKDYKFIDEYLAEAQLIISADSGARHCRRMDITPDFLIGDFDSINDADYLSLVEAGVQVKQYPAKKDMTDSEIAVQVALEKGCDRIVLLGAIGSRLDHTAANLSLLKKLADLRVEGIIVDENNEARIIRSNIELRSRKDTFVTLLPFAGDAVGVTTGGLQYPLKDAVLEVGSSWGVSNQFAQDIAHVEVKEGYLLVIMSRD
ncbi:MAG: thiamine diphosphokinase [Clostridiaceae bacterium]|jgi:thiamine pyrophosphokinase|nr:thiamine diphosphokinase [Clostridiaceae bacterium]